MRTLWVEAKCFQHVNKNTLCNECVHGGKWRVTRREEKGSSHSRSLTSVRKQRDRVRDDNSRKVARDEDGTIGN
jgi:hypothetical protein